MVGCKSNVDSSVNPSFEILVSVRAVKAELREDLPQPLTLHMSEHIFCKQKHGDTAGDFFLDASVHKMAQIAKVARFSLVSVSPLPGFVLLPLPLPV